MKSIKDKRILIVDDEEEIRELLDKKLSRNKYNCVKAPNISDALTKLTNESFGLILLDIHLKDGRGESILDFIKSKKNNTLNLNTPVVVISGHLDGEIIKSLKDKIVDAIIKPFSDEMLLEKVAKYFKKN